MPDMSQPAPDQRGLGGIPDGTYSVDLTRTQVGFRAKAFGLLWVRGTMPVVSGALSVRNGRMQGSGAVAANQVSTGVGPRDWHLRTSHYLHTKAHPNIDVAVQDTDLDAGTARCEVVVRDRPNPVTMTIRGVTVTGGTVRIDAGVALDRTPYPMLPPLAGVSRVVDVDVVLVADKSAN